jgi:hypothetical protein
MLCKLFIWHFAAEFENELFWRVFRAWLERWWCLKWGVLEGFMGD